MKFLSPEVALCLYKSTIWPCMEYCCHVCAGAPSCYLEQLDELLCAAELLKQICRTVGPLLAASLEPLAYCQNLSSLSLFCRYYFGRCSSEMNQLVPLPYSGWRSACYSGRLHEFSVTIPRYCKDVFVNNFLCYFLTFQLDSGVLCLQNAFLLPMIWMALSLKLTDTY